MSNALTNFGILCRGLRTENNKTMGDQADAMAVDVSFISAVETGAYQPPPEYVQKFGNWLNLAEHDRKLLQRREALVIAFPSRKHVSKNSNSIRLFRKISRMNPDEIRGFRKQDEGERKDDG